MAGVKKSTGPAQTHRKFFIDGQEYRPCKVTVKKLYSNGMKTYMSVVNIVTGDLIMNNGRPVPIGSIEWD